MEFAAAAMSSLAGVFSSGGAAAGAGAAAAGGNFLGAGLSAAAGAGSAGAGAGGLFSAIGGASTFASILSGGMTVASALQAQRAGKDQALGLEFQAQDAEVEGRQEMIAGMERRNSLRRALVDSIAEQDTAYAASGVDLSFGTPVVARQQASRSAERAMEIDQSTEDMRRARFGQKAGSLRLMAAASRRGGLAKASGLLLDGAAQAVRRG
jgi:hypothetical protein